MDSRLGVTDSEKQSERNWNREIHLLTDESAWFQ